MHLDELASTCSPEATIGIGLPAGDPREEEVVAGACCHLHVFRNAGSLLDALADGAIDAAVRGALPANELLGELKSRGLGRGLRRIALLTLLDGRSFLLGPVGIDEGGTLAKTRRLASDMKDFCGLLGWEPRVALLSAGRSEDTARSASIASSIRRAESAADGSTVRNFNIMIEEALQWADCVVAPDGVTGNLIYRTLAHLGGATSLGALYFPLDLRLADTSRSGTTTEYLGAIALATLR